VNVSQSGQYRAPGVARREPLVGVIGDRRVERGRRVKCCPLNKLFASERHEGGDGEYCDDDDDPPHAA